MAANFPNSPNTNDTFTSNGVTFVWNGEAWKLPASPGVKGLKGDQGEKGEKGQKGEKGEKGVKGEIGSSGNPGGKGDKGAPGVDGSDGSDGDKGQKGEKGQKGQDGADATGTKGQKGDTGAKGQKGEDNSTKGEKGQKGQDGTDATGTKGEKGQKGQDGTDATGSKGEKGQKGQDGADATGTKGQKGEKGQIGADGGSGADGTKGQKGDTGAAASKGEKGQKGQDGTDATGTKGEKGQKGIDGDDGASVKGQKGDPGADNSTKGQKGEPGASTKGQKGDPGQKGEQGASGSATISNNADNRVITGGTGTNLNAEQNLTFDGSTLEVTGTGTPTIESGSNLDITATTTTFSGTVKIPSTTLSNDGDGTYTINGAHLQIGSNAADSLQLWHDSATNLSGISEVGSGDFSIITNGTNLYIQKDATAGYAEDMIHCIANGAVKLFYDGGSTAKVETTSSGAKVNGNLEVTGTISPSGMVVNARTSGYSLVASDAGKLVTMTTGDCSVNQNVFSAGNAVTVYNNSGSSFSILQGSGVTMYLGGTTSTGNRTLHQRGMATIVCVASNTFSIAGSGLS